MRASWAWLAILICGSAHAERLAQCDDLVGTWVNQRFEYSLGAHRTAISHYAKDGSHSARFTYEQQASHFDQLETGRWRCAGDQLTIFVDFIDDAPVSISHTYRIEQLSADSLIISTSVEDCSSINGDCDNLVFQAFRVPDQVTDDPQVVDIRQPAR